MGKYKIFVDGSSGTTGLRIADRLAERDEFEILKISEADRKDVRARAAVINESDLSFLCLPDDAAREVMPLVREDVRILDTSTAHRTAPGWVYGLPELHRAEMASARLISGVGCNATSAITALLPLARAGLIEEARIECRVGSSEAGANADEGSAHSMRSRVLRVVNPFVHRHMAEVVQELSMEQSSFTMGVTAVELVRGIQCLAHVTLNRQVREAEIWKLYRAAWNGEPFVSFTPAKPAHFRIPDPRFVIGSNRVLTGFMLAEDGHRMIAASAIDNLMKGAAGSAVQCANLMFGLPETEGLDMMPVYPA